jgi:hypothetical protein
MSNSSNDNTDFNDGDDALRDPALRRALDHAPDHDATPDPRTRDAIRKMAHNLAAAPALTPVSAADGASAALWWRRLFGGGGTGAHMPWNAAFATVLVATFVAVLWHREPVPDAQLDGEARVSGAAAPAPAPAPAQPSAQSAPQSPSPAVVVPQAPAAPAADPPAASARDSSKDAVDSRAADAVRRAPAPSSKQAAPAPEINRKPVESSPQPPPPSELAAAPAPVVPASPPAPAAAAPGIAEQSTRLRESSESELSGREKRSAYVGGAPAPAAPSVAPPSTTDLARAPSAPAVAAAAPAAPAAAPAHRELADSPPAVVAQGNADTAASGGLRQQAPSRAIAAAKVARPSADTASFSALDRWTSFNFTRAGLGGRHARGDIEGLAALVNTVARSATAADAPLGAPVEARLELYRGGALLAVLEIAGDQVRWTPQPGGTALVGTPPAQTLDALRALLTR